MKIFLFCTILLATAHGNQFNRTHRRTDEMSSNNNFRPVVGAGVNMVNIFWERLMHVLKEDNDDTDEGFVDVKNPRHSFKLLKSKGIDLVRFAASPYCQSQFAMWRLGGEQEDIYWSILDDIMNEAHIAGVRLIPTLIWRPNMVSLGCQEPVSMLFQTEKPSCARNLIRLYSQELVSRYQHFDNIVAWELFNELNLNADISHKVQRSMCRWDIHKKRNVCTTAPKVFSIQAHNSTLLSKQEANTMITQLGPQCLSTSSISSHACNCSGDEISNTHDFSSLDMINFYRDFAGWVREVDVLLRLPISSGHAMPRRQSWHMAHVGERTSKWTLDSSRQFCEQLLYTHQHVELASIHPYIHTKKDTNGSSLEDEVVFTLDGRTVKLLALVKLALQCISQSERPYPRQLYIGEFGYLQGSYASLSFVRHVLDMVSEVTTNNGLGGGGTNVKPLMTLWVYEFKPQHKGLSIESERDAWLIDEIATANKLAYS